MKTERLKYTSVLMSSFNVFITSEISFVQVNMLNFYILYMCKLVAILPPLIPAYEKEPLGRRKTTKPKLVASK